MKSNYKKLGPYIRQINIRNGGLSTLPLLGVSIQKVLMPSIANVVGTDMSTYKRILREQFAYGPVTSRNGDKISVALLTEHEEALVSQSYTVFEIVNKEELLPEYLMMWFMRPEFDRYARFMSHGSAREIFDWDEMCNVELPIPSIERQREIVAEYQTIQNRIKLNEQLNKTLEDAAQVLYKHWFIDFEFPDENGKPYKSSGGKMVYCKELDKDIPVGWEQKNIGSYSKVKSGYAFSSSLWSQGGIPVIKIGSIQNNTIEIDENDFVSDNLLNIAPNYIGRRGDLVIAMTGATIGKIALLPATFNCFLINQRVGIFNLGGCPIDRSSFLYLTLKTEYVQNEIASIGGDSAQANISGEQIENIKIAIDNGEIVNKYNTVCKPMFDTILDNKKQNVIISKVQSLLLSKMSSLGNNYE